MGGGGGGSVNRTAQTDSLELTTCLSTSIRDLMSSKARSDTSDRTDESSKPGAPLVGDVVVDRAAGTVRPAEPLLLAPPSSPPKPTVPSKSNRRRK